MAKVDIWMPLYIGDYTADTMRLSTEQHGAYLLMLMEQWMSGPLPDDDEELSLITKLPIDRWMSMRGKLSRFFEIDGVTWTQKRLAAEKELAEKRRVKASENGKKGGRPTISKKPTGNLEVNPEKTYGLSLGLPRAKAKHNPDHNRMESSSPSPSPSPTPTEPKTHSLPRKELPTEVDPITGEILTWGDVCEN
tara:strand:+ start:461 stop:1039 length:579 start_codon:yes stop_codon:yes gene_type:complete